MLGGTWMQLIFFFKSVPKKTSDNLWNFCSENWGRLSVLDFGYDCIPPSPLLRTA